MQIDSQRAAEAWIHPYVEQLSARVASQLDKRVVIKCRTLLRGFGYERRTERVVGEIRTLLASGNLETDLALTYPHDIDDRVSVQPLIARQAEVLAPQSPTRRGSPSNEGNAWDEFSDLPATAERAIAATVTIISADSSFGSGFIVDPQGLVVTACHVVTGSGTQVSRTVQVRLADDREMGGTIVRFHRRLDFALLWVGGAGPFPTLPIGTSKALRSAETVLAIGSPSAFTNTVSRGIVSNPRRTVRGVEYIQTDASIDHGNSGGPLVNVRGMVVGVALWEWGTLDSAKFALPVEYLSTDVREALQAGHDLSVVTPMCALCGFAEYRQPTWYCRNCGFDLGQAAKEQVA